MAMNPEREREKESLDFEIGTLFIFKIELMVFIALICPFKAIALASFEIICHFLSTFDRPIDKNDCNICNTLK